MARLRDPKTGRFVKASQIQITNDSSIVESVMEPVPEVEQVVDENVRSDIVTGEAVVLGQDEKVEEQIEEQIVDQEETKEVVQETKPKKAKNAQFSSENSRAGAIENALVAGADGIDSIVEAVMEVRPDDDPKKVKSQINAILRDIRNGRGRWKKYNIVKTDEILKIVLK